MALIHLALLVSISFAYITNPASAEVKEDCYPSISMLSPFDTFGSWNEVKDFTSHLFLEIKKLHKKWQPHLFLSRECIWHCPTRVVFKKVALSRSTAYLPPEVAKNGFEYKSIVNLFAVDIYSAGSIVYDIYFKEIPSGYHIFQYIHFETTYQSHGHNWGEDKKLSDFLHWVLQKDPSLRPSAEVALTHPWFTGENMSSSYGLSWIKANSKLFSDSSKSSLESARTLDSITEDDEN